MEVISREPTLFCNLAELWEEFISPSEDRSFTKEDLENDLRGQSNIKPSFRIEVGEFEVFLNSRELLCRLANMPKIEKFTFINAIVLAMKTRHVHRMEMVIPWSKNGTKVLIASTSSKGDRISTLDLELAQVK